MSEAPEHRIRRLAYSFPSLRKFYGGVQPWNANTLNDWASGAVSHGEAVSARFLLAVWDPNHPWTAGHFDVMEALRVWDFEHHKAFLDWASDPWWP